LLETLKRNEEMESIYSDGNIHRSVLGCGVFINNIKGNKMAIEQLSNADRQMIIEDYHQFNDDSPLTEETLEELGFEKILGGQKIGKSFMSDRAVHDFHRINKGQLEIVVFDGEATMPVLYNSPTWKTVGSVRMLIEALKGDE
jgi:hypothetical protein